MPSRTQILPILAFRLFHWITPQHVYNGCLSSNYVVRTSNLVEEEHSLFHVSLFQFTGTSVPYWSFHHCLEPGHMPTPKSIPNKQTGDAMVGSEFTLSWGYGVYGSLYQSGFNQNCRTTKKQFSV